MTTINREIRVNPYSPISQTNRQPVSSQIKLPKTQASKNTSPTTES